jgi:hypothetical protein
MTQWLPSPHLIRAQKLMAGNVPKPKQLAPFLKFRVLPIGPVGARVVSTKLPLTLRQTPYHPQKPGYGRLTTPYPVKSQDTRSLTAAFPGNSVVNHRHTMLDNPAMKIIALILPILSTTMLCGAQPIDILMKNTWISDKPATVIWINAHRPSSPAIEKIKNLLFGKLKISFTTDTVTTDLDGKVEKYSQKIIGKTQHAVAAITHDVNLDRDVIVTIEIDDDEMGYWIYNSQYDIKEHFIPVN